MIDGISITRGDPLAGMGPRSSIYEWEWFDLEKDPDELENLVERSAPKDMPGIQPSPATLLPNSSSPVRSSKTLPRVCEARTRR